jgi:hypothetical protein
LTERIYPVGIGPVKLHDLYHKYEFALMQTIICTCLLTQVFVYWPDEVIALLVSVEVVFKYVFVQLPKENFLIQRQVSTS